MNTPRMTDEFAEGFRARLIEHVVQQTHPRRRWAMLGGGAALTVILGGSVAAAASGLLVLPGTTEATAVSTPAVGSFVGTDALALGPRPAEASGIALSFNCLTAGSFTFDDGAGVTCSTPADASDPTTYVLGLDSVEGEKVTVTTAPESAWNLTATYVTAGITAWGVNDSGQTYGVINEHGEPELIAVIATNGEQGYVLRRDLEDANGTTAMREFESPEDALAWREENAGIVHFIPVFKADGTTRIGGFQVGG